MGRSDELAAGRRQLEPTVERASEVGLDLDRVLVEAAVAKAERELGRAAAARDERLEPGSSGSKSTSQIHETSRPSAISSLRATTSTLRCAAVDERPHRLVRAGGILDQEQEEPLVADRDPLEAPERGGEALEPGGDLVERRAERAGERRCREAL